MNKLNQTAVINVKVEPRIKMEAMEIVDGLGLTLSAFINASLKHLVRVRSVHFTLDNEIPSDYLINELENSKRDIESGNVVSFSATKDALTYVDNIISARSK